MRRIAIARDGYGRIRIPRATLDTRAHSVDVFVQKCSYRCGLTHYRAAFQV